jgi:hypothetical protein
MKSFSAIYLTKTSAFGKKRILKKRRRKIILKYHSENRYPEDQSAKCFDLFTKE